MMRTTSTPAEPHVFCVALLLAATALASPALAATVPWPSPPAADSIDAAVPEANGDTDDGMAPGGAPATVPDTTAARRTIPGLNAHATAVRMVRLSKSAHNVVRSGPGERFAIVGVFAKRASFRVIAKSGQWYGVRLSQTETGWVHASLCEEYDDLSDLEFRPNPKLYSRTGMYTLTGYGGAYAFDRKSNSVVLGGRLGYYVFDRLQAEAGLAWTHVRRPAEIVESLFGLTLEEEKFHMLFYHFDLLWEVLPGRQMVPFVTAGVGSSIMLGDAEPGLNFGAGTTLFLSKRVATRWEFRDYRFDTGAKDARVANNNVEFTVGTSVLF